MSSPFDALHDDSPQAPAISAPASATALGELLVVGVSGPALTDREAELLGRVQPGGVILFRRNVKEADQLAQLVADIRRAVPGAILYSDSEGGSVDRLAPLVGSAPAGALLAATPPRFARRSGRWIGEALRLWEIDVDFAPVVDLDFTSDDPETAGNALDRRTLGRSPRTVVARARAFLEGLHRAGVAGCLKHYPGLGRSRGDTHHQTGWTDASAEKLALDHQPFEALGELAASVMAAHAVYPALDPDERPASLSPKILGVLRSEVGFRGVIFSDDLEMRALEPWGDLPTRAVRSLEAGCDGVLLCHTLEAAPDLLAALGDPSLEARTRESLGRMAVWRRHLEALREGRRRAASLAEVRRRLETLGEEARRAARHGSGSGGGGEVADTEGGGGASDDAMTRAASRS